MRTSTLLTDKYRPQSFGELVLPQRHNLGPVAQFLQNPHPSAWLFTGPSGVGKTSLGLLMAQCASDRSAIYHLVGCDLDSNKARDLENFSQHRPLFGGFHSFVINEADGIPRGGQIRLLQILENLSGVWIFTSNDVSAFDERFLSRVRHLPFTTQGLLAPATSWIMDIAAREGLVLDHPEAEKLIRNSKNNLRKVLRTLELSLLEQTFANCP